MWTGDHGRPLTQDEVHRRASGRRGYNARRAFAAAYRRHRLAQLLAAGIWGQGELARRLRVDRSTITRDLQKLKAERPACALCGCTCQRPPRPAPEG
jgi:DNA invertase Pin-like site-specific DNA recombinase